MPNLLILIRAPEPVHYIALPDTSGDPDRAGYWKVCEGPHPEAPIVAHCPNEIFAQAVASALNTQRALIEKRVTVLTVPQANHVRALLN